MRYAALINCIFFILIGCTSSKINPSNVNQDAFPPEFGNPDQILLIEKRPPNTGGAGVNNYLEKSFTKNYTGKFELATAAEILNNSKYVDKSIYRYILSDQVWTNPKTRLINGRMQTDWNYRMDFHLYDRKEDKDYPSLGVYSAVVAKAINRTAVLLNDKLKK